MPWKVFVALLAGVLGLAALTVAIATEVLPGADHANAWRLFITGAMLLALAWRGLARRNR
jgi:hypothetical protein